MPDLPPHQRVTIVSVAYNSMLVLPKMLAAVPKGTPVVLVDNASKDVDALRQLAQKHAAQLILNPENCGFGVACNQGAVRTQTEFLLFLNPDAVLGPKALDLLVAAAARYPKASAFNPRIEEDDGSAFFKRKSNLMPRSERMPRGWPAADCEVPVLSGAAMFVRRTDFDAIGGFDPEIFLFHEDDDLSRRLRSERGPLMFIRDAHIRHLGGSSSVRSAEIAALKAWHMGHSRVYASQKHGQPLARTRALVQATMQLVSPVVLLSGRKRAKQWAYLKGTIHASFGHKSSPGGPK